MLNDTKECELCHEECGFRFGCSVCGKMVCSSCLAALDEGDDEIVCEGCF